MVAYSADWLAHEMVVWKGDGLVGMLAAKLDGLLADKLAEWKASTTE
jgi:hypothetical protein